jgi:glycosyltransferase involved in cell wall biosynthesis
MRRYVSTIAVGCTGEAVEMAQLARAAGAKVVDDVPPEGPLVYMSNLNIRHGVQDLPALAERKRRASGTNAVIVGVCKGWGEAETWRRYFSLLDGVADIVFVHHPEQVRYLAQFGVEAVLKPINEERYRGPRRHRPGTVLYTGFLWEEKDLALFVAVAELLPDVCFTIQVGQPVQLDAALPDNCELLGGFVPQERYLELLAGYETIWIPRKPTDQIYAGRSGLSAVASGRPVLLPDVGPNDVVPDGVAFKYPPTWSAEQIARLIRSRPRPRPERVARFLERNSPGTVWQTMLQEMNLRGLAF